MHLWLSYFLSSQLAWITYHVIPGIKAKLITQVIIIVMSNDILRGGPYWSSRDRRMKKKREEGWGGVLELCLTTGACQHVKKKKKIRSAAGRELQSVASLLKSNLRPVIRRSAFTCFSCTPPSRLLSPKPWACLKFGSPAPHISVLFF